MRTRRSLLAVITGLLPLAAMAAGAHEHGAAQADIAIDGNRALVAFSSPLDNLLGFERAPRTDAERRTVEATVARLKAAGELWRFEPEAKCVPGSVLVRSAVLGVGMPASTAPGEHGDIDAEFEFVCARPPAWVEAQLFAAFSRLQRVDVQTAGPAGQGRTTLRRPAVRIPLAK